MLDKLIGNKLIKLNEVDSTNSYASRLLFDEQVTEGTAIMAQFQHSGRGQRASSWQSEKGKNLLVSYILFPSFLSIGRHFELNQILALALHNCIQAFTSSEVKIKWPNDIMINDTKIAGMLIENTIRSNNISFTIAGYGININQTEFNDFEPAATSLYLMEEKEFDTNICFKELNHQLNKWYTKLQLGHSSNIKSTYESLLYRLNETSTYESSGIKFSGNLKRVNNDGQLIISTAENQEKSFNNKDVRFIF